MRRTVTIAALCLAAVGTGCASETTASQAVEKVTSDPDGSWKCGERNLGLGIRRCESKSGEAALISELERGWEVTVYGTTHRVAK